MHVTYQLSKERLHMLTSWMPNGGMIYCKRATSKLLEDTWETENIHMRFTTVGSIKKHGFLGMIWEEVEPPKDDD